MAAYVDTDEFIADFLIGKDRAFNALHTLYSNRIYVYAVGLIGDGDEAKDITIEGFRKLFEKHGDFHQLKDIRGFLYLVTKNSCLDYLKASKRLSERQRQFWDALESGELESPEVQGELLHDLYKAVEALSPEVRRVIKLLYVENLSYQEAADRLDVSKETVKTYRKRGIEKLRNIMQEKYLVAVWLMVLAARR